MRTEAARFFAYYGQISEEAQKQLIFCVTNELFTIDLRTECGNALAEQGVAAALAASAAATLTRHKESRLRELGATLLKVMGPTASEQIPDLLRLLKNSDPAPRYEAGRALARIGRAALAKVVRLVNSQAADVRDGAIFTLGEAGTELPPGAAAVLAGVVLRGDNSDASVALRALEKLGPLAAEAVPGLVEAMETRSSELKAKIASALGYIHERADLAVPVLQKALKERSGDVRALAAHALVSYGAGAQGAFDDLARTLLKDKEVDVRALSVEAIVATGSDPEHVRSLLIEALKDDWPTTRMVASQSLSRFGAPAVPALLAQLDAAESNVREAAADALWKIGAPLNVPALTKLVGLWLADLGSVRVAAGNALRTMGRSALIALPDFLLDFSHPNPSRRQETAALIADIFQVMARDVSDLDDATLGREANAIRNAASLAREALKDGDQRSEEIIQQIEASLALYSAERAGAQRWRRGLASHIWRELF